MVDLRGVHKVNAKGRTYYYAWRGGPRLTAEPGTGAFVEQLAAAQAARVEGDRSKISGLCAMFRASDEWKALAPKTRNEWSRWLDRIQIEFGDLSLRAVGRTTTIRPIFRKWRAKYASTPRAADMGMQTLSRLMSFAVDNDLLEHNPCAGIKRLYKADRAALIWTADHLAELEKHASPVIWRAAKLASLTGLRKADLLRLAWTHVQPNYIEIRTAKTGSTAVIPLYDELRAFLATIKRGRSTQVLLNSDGKPWGSGFGASWNRAVKAAEIDLHFHDLRGTAATRFYLAGLQDREIAEILGWSEPQVQKLLNTYVRRDAMSRERASRVNAAGTDV
jgi:integrase